MNHFAENHSAMYLVMFPATCYFPTDLKSLVKGMAWLYTMATMVAEKMGTLDSAADWSSNIVADFAVDSVDRIVADFALEQILWKE
ncbi:MAG: hypothetical protein ACXU8A_11205 [Burkholderiaceae bacterium]